MNNLVYLTYGQGPHIDELAYSVVSARYMSAVDNSKYRIVVYTDEPARCGDLPVEIEPIDSEHLTEWAGPFNFNHRRKIVAVKNALEKFGGRVALCDTDTYFVKPPSELFGRIRAGHTLIHAREGDLNSNNASGLRQFLKRHNLRTVAGKTWNITARTPMFNSGVIGIEETDITLLDEAIHLVDQIYAHVKIHTVEQFAIGACFDRRATLHEAFDVVCHYWPMPGRALFQEELRRLLHDPSIGSNEERFHRISACRPVPRLDRPEPTLKQRLHFAFRRVKDRARKSRFRLGTLPVHFRAARRQ